jgi:hypothetical protein
LHSGTIYPRVSLPSRHWGRSPPPSHHPSLPALALHRCRRPCAAVAAASRYQMVLGEVLLVRGVGGCRAQLGKTMAAAGIGKPGRRPRGRSGRCSEADCWLLGAVVAWRPRQDPSEADSAGPTVHGRLAGARRIRPVLQAPRWRRPWSKVGDAAALHWWVEHAHLVRFAARGRWLDKGWCRPAAGWSWGDAGGVRKLGTGTLACRMRGCRDSGPGQWLVASRSLQIRGL